MSSGRWEAWCCVGYGRDYPHVGSQVTERVEEERSEAISSPARAVSTGPS